MECVKALAMVFFTAKCLRYGPLMTEATHLYECVKTDKKSSSALQGRMENNFFGTCSCFGLFRLN